MKTAGGIEFDQADEHAADDVASVAVVGSGLIGSSHAVLFARAGIDVHVHDADARAMATSRDRVATIVDREVAAGRRGLGSPVAMLARISWHSSLTEAVGGAQYVQECVREDLAVKQSVFRELDAVTQPSVVLASSTAMLPISRIATEVGHPARCIVAHPTNPPHLLRFVEIVPGAATSLATTKRTWALLRRVGQHPALCRKEIPGFVLNRLQFALEREAYHLLREGVASVADIDAAVSEGLGPRWAFLGPFAVEETNGPSVEVSLRADRATFDNLMAGVCAPFAGLSDDDILAVAQGIYDWMGDRTHDDLLAHRDAMLLEIRRLKDQ